MSNFAVRVNISDITDNFDLTIHVPLNVLSIVSSVSIVEWYTINWKLLEMEISGKFL